MQDMLSLRGDVSIQLNGITVLEKKNLIVQAGKNLVAQTLVNTSATPFSHMAIGTSSVVATLGDTTLGGELVRQPFTTTNITANVVTLTCSYGPGVGTGNIQEAGIFNAASTGTMLSRLVFASIGKGVSDTLIFTWTITVG